MESGTRSRNSRLGFLPYLAVSSSTIVRICYHSTVHVRFGRNHSSKMKLEGNRNRDPASSEGFAEIT